MASRNKDERAYVNVLIRALQKNSPPSRSPYVYIDRDAGAARHTSSGFDFAPAYGGRIVFCEAKVGKGKLSDWQEFTRAQILASGTPYLIVRFWEDGKYFSVSEYQIVQALDPLIETEKASITDFIKF